MINKLNELEDIELYSLIVSSDLSLKKLPKPISVTIEKDEWWRRQQYFIEWKHDDIISEYIESNSNRAYLIFTQRRDPAYDVYDIRLLYIVGVDSWSTHPNALPTIKYKALKL